MTATVAAHVVRRSLAGAAPLPFWLDTADRPAPRPPLPAHGGRTGLAIVGGGFCGLWTAVRAKQRYPGLDVTLIEGERLAWAASGRNGGFCAASLTHGRANGMRHAPDEVDRLDALGMQNLDDIEAFVRTEGIDCGFERRGTLSVATAEYQVEDLRASGGRFLDRGAVRAQIDSPTYLAGSWDEHNTALLDPARLAWGLADVAERLGVRIAEQTAVTGLTGDGSRLRLRTAVGGSLTADRVALATNAFPSLIRRTRLYTVPVYDHVLVTERLTAGQLADLGWRNRQGVEDTANQFHYYRLTRDDRILWGGYDAIYHSGRRVRPEYDQRPETSRLLAQHFFTTFPQLRGLRFTHRWGGAIDTCTRFFAFHGTAHHGLAAYAAGFTGLGVGATRFSADVMLDLLFEPSGDRLGLRAVRRKPLPFPPEPLATVGIALTRRSLAAADRNEGRRNLWLRGLDALGMGFDT